MEDDILTRRNIGIFAGMLTAVALTAGALITSTNRPANGPDGSVASDATVAPAAAEEFAEPSPE